VKADRIRMRSRTSEELVVDVPGHGPIDWTAGSLGEVINLELCVEDLIEAGLLPAPGEPEGPVERAWWPADRAIAYLIEGIPVEWGDWPPEMISMQKRGEIKLAELISDGVPATGRRKPCGSVEDLPASDLRPDMVRLLVTPRRWPKVVVRVDGTVGTTSRRQADYMGSPWSAIEVDSVKLRHAAPNPLRVRTKEMKPATAVAEVSRSTTEARIEMAEALQEPERKVAEAPQGKHRGGASPVWDWEGVIARLKQRKAGESRFKDKTTFKDKATFKRFIQKNVQRVDGSDRGDGPDESTVRRAIIKRNLEQYATFEE
jgi:hypothetical protein